MIPNLTDIPKTSEKVHEFIAHLKKQKFQGECGLSYGERLVAATDNSIYQVLPEAVLFPREKSDLLMILALLNREEFRSIKVSPRGGGTGTNGQSLTDGIMIDVSRFMNKILEVNYEENWVRVQPGVVLDQLNKVLKPRGLFFAPDLSPSKTATLGGMAAMDACGKGSRIYGKTSDHVLDMDLALIGGKSHKTSTLTPVELDAVKKEGGIVGDIHATVDSIVKNQKDRIEKVFPDLTRFLAGYNLAKVIDSHGRFNLNYLIAGSEGTLCFLSELKLKIIPIPKFKRLVLVKYLNFQDGLSDAKELLSFDPSAIETVDGNILSLARKDNLWIKVKQYFNGEKDDQALCAHFIEFVGDDLAAIDQKIKGMIEFLDSKTGIEGSTLGYEVASTEEDIAALWNMRKKGVGLLGNRPGQRRPIPFVEDTLVPPENLAPYIKEFRKLLDGYGLQYGMFGHVDVGCLHVRPALNLKEQADERLVRAISDEVALLVKKYGGVFWGEHGKGLRSEYMPEFFGPLYQHLQEIKTAFDPNNQLNPGKLATPKNGCHHLTKIDEVPFRGHYDKDIKHEVRETYAVAVNCNGNGACYNFDPDHVMCPSYKVTRDRRFSPKGRAGLMREWLRLTSLHQYDANTLSNQHGNLQSQNSADDFSHEVYQVMSGCLSCKACSSQCPIKVDIPELKSRFLNHYHSKYKRPLKDRLIAKTENLHILTSYFPFFYNMTLRLKLFQFFSKKLLGMVDPPAICYPRLEKKIPKNVLHANPAQLAKLTDAEKEMCVILVQDTVTSLYESDVVKEIAEFIGKLGGKVYLLPLFENGKAKHVKGFLPEFVDVAKKANKILKRFEGFKIPFVGIDPALTLTYREEYPRYLGKERGKYQVLMIQEWLSSKIDSWQFPKTPDTERKVAWLAHCGEVTSGPASPNQWKEIYNACGIALRVIPVGCCGMAGAFGHEVDHLEESKKAFEISWGMQIAKLKKRRI